MNEREEGAEVGKEKYVYLFNKRTSTREHRDLISSSNNTQMVNTK
jgi:hypothetical protein